MWCCESPVLVWEGATVTPDCSRADLSCTPGVAVAPVLGWIKRDLWSTGRAAVNSSGLFYARTSQNCNLRVWYALLFLLMERKLSSYSRCVFHIFPSVRHLYHTQLSPLALLVITCLLLSAVVILGGFLLIFWVVCFLLNHSNPSRIALLVFFPYPFFYGLVFGGFFLSAL